MPSNNTQLLFAVVLAATICGAISLEGKTSSFSGARPVSTSLRSFMLEYARNNQVTPPRGIVCGSCVLQAWLSPDKQQNVMMVPASMVPSIVGSFPDLMRDPIMAVYRGGPGAVSSSSEYGQDLYKAYPEMRVGLGAAVHTAAGIVQIGWLSAHVTARRDLGKPFDASSVQLALQHEAVRLIQKMALTIG